MRAKKTVSWSDVKTRLVTVDRTELISLVQDLNRASKDNQVFLHARFSLGEDVLKPYKRIIDRWLYPDVFKHQDTSAAKAKKAIADYKKGTGLPAGIAELMTFYCERAADFSREYGLQDEPYFDAMIRMFEQASKIALTLTTEQRDQIFARLSAVSDICHDLGYGVGDDMDAVLEALAPCHLANDASTKLG